MRHSVVAAVGARSDVTEQAFEADGNLAFGIEDRRAQSPQRPHDFRLALEDELAVGDVMAAFGSGSKTSSSSGTEPIGSGASRDIAISPRGKREDYTGWPRIIRAWPS